MMEISPVVPQEPFDSEVQSLDDDSYDVVTEDASAAEFDPETLTTPDQCSPDDETYEKQLAVSAGELHTSPETACLSDDPGLQPSISRPEYNGTSHSGASPSDACSSSGTAADVAVSSCGYVGGSEFQQNSERVADPETLRALGVVGRADHSVTTPDQCSADDDDETYEKQLAVSASELLTSPETACLLDDPSLQPSISRHEYNGTSHSGASPSDACSSSVTAADVAVSSSGYVWGSEFQQNAERVAEDDTLRKNVIVDVAVANDGEQVSASDNAELMVSVVTRWPEGHEVDSVHDTRTLAPRMTEDTSNTGGLISSDSSPPAALSDELKSDTCALPASEPLQQGPSVNSDSGDTASTDDCTTNCWLQSLRGAMIWAVQVGVHFYRNATV